MVQRVTVHTLSGTFVRVVLLDGAFRGPRILILGMYYWRSRVSTRCCVK